MKSLASWGPIKPGHASRRRFYAGTGWGRTFTPTLRRWILIGAGGLLLPCCATAEPVFRAGAAKANISPPLGRPIVGNWVQYPAEFIHDELWARSLVLDDGTTQLAIVVVDNISLRRSICDAARKQIEDETGIPGPNILIAATHTHSSIFAGYGPYQRVLIRAMAESVRTAQQQLEPARIGFGRAEVKQWVFNRRWFMRPGDHLRNPFGGADRVRTNPPTAHPALVEPAGPTDPAVTFISLQSTRGRPIALLANYSLHYVGGIPRGDVSADYFGVFAERIGELLGADEKDPPFIGILSNGSSGDINSVNRAQSSRPFAAYEKMRLVAEDVAQAVRAAHEDIRFLPWIPLAATLEEVSLRSRKPNTPMLSYARKIEEKPEDQPAHHRLERNYAQRIRNQEKAPDSITVPIQAFRLGPMGIVAIPFEVFVEIGLDLKARSPLPHTFTISFGNGSFGYLPTPRHHQMGGYETWMGTNRVMPESSDVIQARLLSMLSHLQRARGTHAPLRAWTSVTGQHVEADFVARQRDLVLLRDNRGEWLGIQFDALTAEDQREVLQGNTALRTWTNEAGTRVEAQFVERQPDTVLLRDASRSILRIRYAALVTTDQQYVSDREREDIQDDIKMAAQPEEGSSADYYAWDYEYPMGLQ